MDNIQKKEENLVADTFSTEAEALINHKDVQQLLILQTEM
jgi:hypothetical protein